MLHSNITLIVALLLCVAAAKLYAQDTQTYATAKKDGTAASKRGEDAPANVLSPEEWRRVDAAVDRALTWIASQQQDDGSFPTDSLEQTRNQITHSFWAVGIANNTSTRIKRTAKEARGFHFSAEQVSEDELADTAKQLRILAYDIMQFWLKPLLELHRQRDVGTNEATWRIRLRHRGSPKQANSGSFKMTLSGAAWPDEPLLMSQLVFRHDDR